MQLDLAVILIELKIIEKRIDVNLRIWRYQLIRNDNFEKKNFNFNELYKNYDTTVILMPNIQNSRKIKVS